MNETALTVVSLILGGGGAISSVVAFFRLKSDKARTTVSAAEGAVFVQSNVINNLEKDNARLREENEELRDLLAVIDERKNARRAEDT